MPCSLLPWLLSQSLYSGPVVEQLLAQQMDSASSPPQPPSSMQATNRPQHNLCFTILTTNRQANLSAAHRQGGIAGGPTTSLNDTHTHSLIITLSPPQQKALTPHSQRAAPPTPRARSPGPAHPATSQGLLPPHAP